MRLVNIDLNVNFEIEENKVYEIVIEDPRCFASTVGMLMASYYKLSLLLIESIEPRERDGEIRYIIDEDLCVIDAN